MKNKLPILEIEDPTKRLDHLIQLSNSIQNGLIEIRIEYTNKISGKFICDENNMYFRLRDSIIYRLDSLIFHLRLLLAIQQNQLQKLNNQPFDNELRHRILDRGREEQIQLFDSIVFHSISLFDYIGNLIDYIAGDKMQMRLKWKGVIYSVRDKNNTLSKSPIAEVILKLNGDLVDRLYEHRSDLIHYSTDLGGAETTLDLINAKPSFTVFCPRRIAQRFSELRELIPKYRVGLNYVAFWLTDKTFAATYDLIGPLLKHMEINRKTSAGFAIFLRRDQDNINKQD